MKVFRFEFQLSICIEKKLQQDKKYQHSVKNEDKVSARVEVIYFK